MSKFSVAMYITIISFHLHVTPTGIIDRMTWRLPFGFTSLRGLDNKITIVNRLDYLYAVHIKSPKSPPILTKCHTSFYARKDDRKYQTNI